MELHYYIFRRIKNSFFEMANVHHLTSSLFTPAACLTATLHPAFKSRQRRRTPSKKNYYEKFLLATKKVLMKTVV